MKNIFKTATPHANVKTELNRAEKYAISLEIKDMLRYCNDNRIKDAINTEIISLYMYSRRFPVFCGGMIMRDHNYYLNMYSQDWKYRRYNDKFLNSKYDNIKKIMGEDNFRSFHEQLNKEIKRLFIRVL